MRSILRWTALVSFWTNLVVSVVLNLASTWGTTKGLHAELMYMASTLWAIVYLLASREASSAGGES